MKYRGKLGVVDAFKFEGDVAPESTPTWFTNKLRADQARMQAGAAEPTLLIDTPKGTINVTSGDFVARDEEGQIHKITAEQLETEYTPLEEAHT